MLRILALLCVVSFSSVAQTDEEKVMNVIQTAYIGGIHNGGPIEDIRNGFHPSFNMVRLVDNKVVLTPIEEWIAGIEKSRQQNTAAAPVKMEGKFVSTTVAGTSANVVLELSRGGKRIFTDHLLLYQFTEGWRIVSKTFYRYPQEK